MIKNTLKHYGFVARSFHWLMAALFVGMFSVAYLMINIAKSDFRFSLYDLHKATGLLLFAFVLLRLVWRCMNAQPQLPVAVPIWQRLIAKGNIVFLYILMFLMPTTGFLTSTLGGHDISFYNIFIIKPFGHNIQASEFFSGAHEILSYCLLGVFALHLLAALYHRYYLKDEVFESMWNNA